MRPRLTNSIVLCKRQSMLLARRKTWNGPLMIFNWMGLVAVTKINVFPTRLVDPSWLCRSPLRCTPHTHPCPLPQAPLAAVAAWGTDAPGSHPHRPNYRQGPAGEGGGEWGGGRSGVLGGRRRYARGQRTQVNVGCRWVPGAERYQVCRVSGRTGGGGRAEGPVSAHSLSAWRV